MHKKTTKCLNFCCSFAPSMCVLDLKKIVRRLLSLVDPLRHLVYYWQQAYCAYTSGQNRAAEMTTKKFNQPVLLCQSHDQAPCFLHAQDHVSCSNKHGTWVVSKNDWTCYKIVNPGSTLFLQGLRTWSWPLLSSISFTQSRMLLGFQT